MSTNERKVLEPSGAKADASGTAPDVAKEKKAGVKVVHTDNSKNGALAARRQARIDAAAAAQKKD